MSNPTSFRVAFESQITKLPPEHQTVIRTQMNAITDLQGAIPALKSQIEALKTSGTTATTSSGTTSTIQNVTTINNSVSGGPVNNQTGVTAYTTRQNDNGAIIILNDASPVAVTLNNSVTLPWYCFILNQGTGLVTVTPQQGLIDGVASQTIQDVYFSIIFFDGLNYWSCAALIVPQNTPGVAHEWISSYNSATGVFTLSRPAFSDISGVAATNQIGTGSPAAGDYVDGGTGAWTPIPPVAYPTYNYAAKTSAYSISATDFQIECTSGTFTVTLPTSVGVTGRVYSIKNTGTGTITLATTSSQTIDGQLTQSLSQWSNIMVMSNSAGWIIL